MRQGRVALLLVVLVLAVGCGKEKSGGQGATIRPRIFDVEVSDFFFVPNEIVIQTGGEPDFIGFHNKTDTAHSFSIDRFSQHLEIEPQTPSLILGDNQIDSTNLGSELPKGRYQFYCRYHRDQGMTGTLIVK